MICHKLLGLVIIDPAYLGRSHHDTVNRFINLFHADGVQVFTYRQNGRFIQYVFKICPREARCTLGQGTKIDIRSQRLIAGMNLEDGFSAPSVR